MNLTPWAQAQDPIDYSVVQALGAPGYWLVAYVPTNVRGYREITVDGINTYSVAGSGYIDAVTWYTALGTAGGGDIFDEDGYGYLTVDFADNVTFPDRSGWLLGHAQAGVATNGAADVIAPCRIPLLGAAWRDVTLERETVAKLDRNTRSAGYAWGSARVWRLALTMHRWSVGALMTGWAPRSQCIITSNGNSPTGPGAMSGANPDGYLLGRVVRIESVRWLDSIENIAEVSVLFATA